MKCDTVCAVVVTYNRKDLLLECLKSLRKQTMPLDAIYLVDNASTDDTPELLMDNGYITEKPPEKLEKEWKRKYTVSNLINHEEIEFYYIRMHKNTGGAGGFYKGVKGAYEKGYDWLWLMDDDSEPLEDALEKLSKHFNDNSALACVVKNKEGKININTRGNINSKLIYPLSIPLKTEEYDKETIEIEFASFVGLIINRKIVEQIGYPKKELFIHSDDFEYCLRFSKKTKILLVNSSTILHKDAYITERSSKRRSNYNELWITYYGIRNLVWIEKKYHKNKIHLYFSLIKYYLLNLAGIILFGNYKFKRIWFITEAYLDGLNGVFDNDKPKRILYQ